MRRCRIVPAIDLIGGRCVRLEQGDFSKDAVVADDPVAQARTFEAQGFSRLHLVDLDGAKQGTPRHLDVLESITRATSLSVDYSGGLRREEDVSAALDRGASQVLLGSVAVLKPEICTEWFSRFGADLLILGLDVLEGLVRVKGWQEATTVTIHDVIERYIDVGLQSVMSTDISKDGMLAGPAFALYRELSSRYPTLRVIASGGVRNESDVAQLAEQGACEVIVGKALYSGEMKLESAGDFVW
jgi:phosphoribosylformimino-5-aminoimidazole carboxamide ribotide isomerase